MEESETNTNKVFLVDPRSPTFKKDLEAAVKKALAVDKVKGTEESMSLECADALIQIKTVIPAKCHFWTKEPLENDDIAGHYETIEMYQDTSHTERSLVKCKSCGQLYYYDYHEEIIWGKGDFHYSTFIPINNDKETIDKLKILSPFEILMVKPRLQWDADPKDNVKIRWQR